MALVTVKIGILMLYHKIFGLAGSRWFRWSIIGLIIFGLMHAVAYGLALIFQCWPIAAKWDTSITDAKCINADLLIFVGAILSITEDFILVLLPISELRKLQMSALKRVGIIVMFAVASL
jgi:hypothetical protein